MRYMRRAFGMSRCSPVSGSVPYHCDTACGDTSHKRATSAAPPNASMMVLESMAGIKACFPGIGKYAFDRGITLLGMSYGERLAKAMELARVDRAKVAAALEISVQAVGQVLNGQSKAFTADKSAKAARFLKVDHYWLATGEGEPRPEGLSEEAQEFGRRYDRLDTDGRAKFSAAIIIAQRGVPDAQVEAQMPITATRRKAKAS